MSITFAGLVRFDHVVIAAAHHLQPFNKKLAGTKVTRFKALGNMVIGIMNELKYTLLIGATRGKEQVMKKMRNPGGSSWETIVLAIIDHLCPVRDDDEGDSWLSPRPSCSELAKKRGSKRGTRWRIVVTRASPL